MGRGTAAKKRERFQRARGGKRGKGRHPSSNFSIEIGSLRRSVANASLLSDLKGKIQKRAEKKFNFECISSKVEKKGFHPQTVIRDYPRPSLKASVERRKKISQQSAKKGGPQASFGLSTQ